MDIIDVVFPPAFPRWPLSHFVASLSQGQISLLMGCAIRYRLRGGVGLCVGIAAGNRLYIVLAIIGWGCCVERRCCLPSSSCWGATYLLWIGSLLLRSRPTTLDVHNSAPRLPRPSLVKQLLLGLGSSLLNPKTPCFIWR